VPQKDITSSPGERGIVYEVIPTRPESSIHVAEIRRRRFGYFWHYHPEIEFTLVLQGQGTRFIGDSIEHFEQGDLCLVGSNLAHCWISDEAQPTASRSIIVQFRPDFLGDTIFTVPELRSIQQLFNRAKRGLRIEGATRADLSAKIISMWRQPPGHWRQILDLLSILALLAQSKECVPLATDRSEPETDQKDRSKINLILKSTNVPPSELPSQKSIAETVRLSPAAFSRFFKRQMGKTYMDYVIDLRIAYVCRALLNTDTGITEIAFNTGFQSLSNFNRQFHKRKGTSPKAWRKQVLEQRADLIRR